VVVQDVQVSKFHAYFRITDGKIELADAGSRNGTWVGEQKLVPKGSSAAVKPGEVVRFGQHTFTLVDAAACWDRVRRPPG
jgi:pSer/pThr/pTyr-binding forkhead associated (FHA) protein